MSNRRGSHTFHNMEKFNVHNKGIFVYFLKGIQQTNSNLTYEV